MCENLIICIWLHRIVIFNPFPSENHSLNSSYLCLKSYFWETHRGRKLLTFSPLPVCIKSFIKNKEIWMFWSIRILVQLGNSFVFAFLSLDDRDTNIYAPYRHFNPYCIKCSHQYDKINKGLNLAANSTEIYKDKPQPNCFLHFYVKCTVSLSGNFFTLLYLFFRNFIFSQHILKKW